ncbi:MAG: AsnC family transcriptional regulator [Phycisphaeraceae bacterium]
MKQDHESQTLDELDARLLDHVQRGVPLEPRPFAALGQAVGISEDVCLQRLGRLRREQGVIRQISAIFDTHALGYASSLVAARIDPAHIDQAAVIISGHPGVSHNYRRSHAFNLWYTLAVPPPPVSRLGLEKTIQRLHELSGAISTRALPTLRLFKIGVNFKMTPGSGTDAESESSAPAQGFSQADREAAAGYTLSDLDKRMILVLQQDLPLVEQPFDDWATQAGCTVDELLAACQRFQERRQMRRFSAVLRHRQAGYGANVMTVWRVAEADIERCGQIMAQCAAVSHCYRRPTYDDWPYSLYTMVHGQSKDQCLATLETIKAQTGAEEYLPLWSLHEYKKVRVKYFTPETAAWEATH